MCCSPAVITLEVSYPAPGQAPRLKRRVRRMRARLMRPVATLGSLSRRAVSLATSHQRGRQHQVGWPWAVVGHRGPRGPPMTRNSGPWTIRSLGLNESRPPACASLSPGLHREPSPVNSVTRMLRPRLDGCRAVGSISCLWCCWCWTAGAAPGTGQRLTTHPRWRRSSGRCEPPQGLPLRHLIKPPCSQLEAPSRITLQPVSPPASFRAAKVSFPHAARTDSSAHAVEEKEHSSTCRPQTL